MKLSQNVFPNTMKTLIGKFVWPKDEGKTQYYIYDVEENESGQFVAQAVQVNKKTPDGVWGLAPVSQASWYEVIEPTPKMISNLFHNVFQHP